MGPLQCRDPIQTTLNPSDLSLHFICIIVAAYVSRFICISPVSWCYQQKKIKIFRGSGLCLQHQLSNSWLSFSICFPPPNSGLSHVPDVLPQARAPARSLVFFCNCGFLGLPGWILVVISQCTHLRHHHSCRRREVFSQKDLLKGHHSLISLGPVDRINADQDCTFMQMQSGTSCRGCRFRIGDRWTFLLRI